MKQNILISSSLALLLFLCLPADLTLSAPLHANQTQGNSRHLKTALGGSMTFLAPAALNPMPLDQLIRHFPDPAHQPTEVLTDPTGSLVLSIEHSKARPSGDLALMRESMSRIFHRTYTDARWFRDEVAPINGRPFAVFELERGKGHQREHIIIQAVTLKNTLLVVTTRAKAQPYWKKEARHLMDSIILYAK